MPFDYDFDHVRRLHRGLAAALDLQTVRVVRQIAEHGSLTAAAEALGYSQPAVSQQLRALRGAHRHRARRAGRPRHPPDRSRGGCSPGTRTPWRPRSRPQPASSPRLRGLRAGRVRLVGLPLGVGRRSCRGSSPRSRRATRASPSRTSRPSRRRRSPPCARTAPTSRITFSYPGDRDDPHRAERARARRCARSASEPIRLVLPAGHPAAAIRRRRPRRARRRPVDRGMPALPRAPARAVRDAPGFEPRIAFETDNFVAVEGMVAQGLGVALLPRWRWRPRRGIRASSRGPPPAATCARCTS